LDRQQFVGQRRLRSQRALVAAPACGLLVACSLESFTIATLSRSQSPRTSSAPLVELLGAPSDEPGGKSAPALLRHDADVGHHRRPPPPPTMAALPVLHVDRAHVDRAYGHTG
jgi:hypothetical protein